MIDCSFGYFRIKTDYVGDSSFDQELQVDKIENPFCVYFPLHLISKADYSDAPYCFIRKKISKEEFDRRWPKFADKYERFSQGGTGDADWVTEDGVYIAEYFTVEEETKTLYALQDGSTTTELPEGETPLRERPTSVRTVKRYLVSQYDVLEEEEEWLGDTIPIIPVLGQETNINGKKLIVSLIRFLKEPAKMFNFWYTAITEQISNAPKAPWLVAEGQIEDFKDEFWSVVNRKNLPYLPYKPIYDSKGELIPPPQRIQPIAIDQTLMSALQISSEALKDVT
jgi:hypothetical protein